MSRVDELKTAIEELPDEEYIELRKWFSEKDWKKWDEKIYKDSESGKLDFLVKEAMDDKKRGKLKDL